MHLTTKGVDSMPRQSAGWTVVAILSTVLLASACTGGGSAASGSAAASPDGPTPGPTRGPTATAAGSAMLTAAPTGSPAGAAPPDATLAVEGGDPVVGQLGSFTWGDGGSDSPWLPGSPVSLGTGERATVTLSGGVRVASWTARRVPAGTLDGSGATGLGGGGATIAFSVPGPGRWSVQVDVRYADDLGSGTYYWQLTVR
jgi:hypothetical protein